MNNRHILDFEKAIELSPIIIYEHIKILYN